MKIDFRKCSSSLLKIGLCLFFILAFRFSVKACQCPLTALSLEECAKYEIIFKGKILRVEDCNQKFGEAIFEVQELYKGIATAEFKVLFECDVECAQKFSPGDEWIIYSRYKQIDNAKIDWCSRSRKFFQIEKEDFYTFTYGNDYYDEVKFLREKLGLHRVSVATTNQDEGRNKRPNTKEMALTLILSIACVVLFYYLFNKFFR